MTKKSPPKIAEDSPIRKHDIAAGKLVLRQRAMGGELVSVEAPGGPATKRRASKR
jgi:hypothetical protein